MSDDQAPAPVEVTNPEPIPVEVTNSRPPDTEAQTTARTVAALSRVDADILRTEDQRRISGIWETTQQKIALSVVWAALIVGVALVLSPVVVLITVGAVPEWAVTASVAGLLFLTGAANLVIGFYFGRTNHQRVGGAVTEREEAAGR